MIIAFRPDNKNPCKQYFFEDFEGFMEWASRSPYKNELLKYQVYENDKFVRQKFLGPEITKQVKAEARSIK